MRYVELRERQISSSGLNFSCFDNDGVMLLPPVTEHVLSAQEQDCLRTLLSLFHPEYSISYVTQLCRKSARMALLGEVFGSSLCRTDRSSYIVAHWPRCSYECVSFSTCTYNQLSVGKVLFFIQHSVSVCGHVYKYVFAFVKWYKEHPQRSWYGSCAIVSSCLYYPTSPFSFIPVQRIIARCTLGTLKVQFHTSNELVCVAVPLESKSSI